MTFKGRTCLYHNTARKGRIFTDVEEYRQALRDGWVDAPWEVDNPDYQPADLKALLLEVPATEVPVETGSSLSDQPLKPWEKALLAKKAKAAARQQQRGVR